jgi:hypothetical protein
MKARSLQGMPFNELRAGVREHSRADDAVPPDALMDIYLSGVNVMTDCSMSEWAVTQAQNATKRGKEK